MRIVQMSDAHVGSGLFRPDLLEATIEESNALEPDLVAIVGDLTMEGYRSEFEACKRFLGELACGHVVVAMGNHDARNVGYRHFEDCFGARDSVTTVPVGEGRAKVVAIDSTKPDLDEARSGASITAGSMPSFVNGRRGPGSWSSTITSWPSPAPVVMSTTSGTPVM
jgi:Icc protein